MISLHGKPPCRARSSVGELGRCSRCGSLGRHRLVAVRKLQPARLAERTRGAARWQRWCGRRRAYLQQRAALAALKPVLAPGCEAFVRDDGARVSIGTKRTLTASRSVGAASLTTRTYFLTVGSVGMLSTALHLQHLQRRRLRLEGSRLPIDDGITDDGN